MHDTLKNIFQTLSENAEENFIKTKTQRTISLRTVCGTAENAV